MAVHKKTAPTPIRLNLWNGVKTIEAGCTFFYYDDIIVNSLQPNFISTKAAEKGVIIKVRGIFFRNDDLAGKSFRIRVGNDMVLDQADYTFVNSTYITFKAPNFPISGFVPVFFSNNYGIQWTDGSRAKDLYYHSRIQVNVLSLPKIQIPLTDNDFDRIQLDIEADGENFPIDTNFGPLWCIFGSNSTQPLFEVMIQAQVVNSTRIKCKDVPQYNKQILPDNTYVEFKVTQNLQEYWGYSQIHYYPRIRIDNISQHNFAQNQERIVFEVHGENFLNYSLNQVMCQINRTVRPEEVINYQQQSITLSENIKDRHFSAYVQFVSPQVIKCSFDRVKMIHSGKYKLQLTNNGVQWVQYERKDRGWLGVGANGVIGRVGQIDVREAIMIMDIQPKMILNRASEINPKTITIQAQNLQPDSECYFVLNSTDRASLLNVKSASLIIKGTLLNETHLSCVMPPDFTDFGEMQINIRIGFERNPKTISMSSMALYLVDRCPNGYFCEDYFIQDCPKGHSCAEGAYRTDKRPCPIGYFNPKSVAQRCFPCLKGTYCEYFGMVEPTVCPAGHICNVQKLTSPRAECPPGYFCRPATTGNEPFFNGLLTNHTNHCNIGTYCRGGQSQNLTLEPVNFESTVQDCLRGFICPQGSKMINGVGACPSGYFCPHRNTTHIMCPPRFFCPERANIEPRPCPKGTFNAHFGQKNCTVCSLGKICPMEGLLLPLPCPPGYVCNKEGLVTPDNLCRMGNICLGNVKSGLKQSERACFIANSVSEDPTDTCNGRLYSPENSTVVADMPTYFFNKTVCCINIYEVAKWIIRIGEAINEKEIFKTYAQSLEQQKDQFQGEFEGAFITQEKYDGHLILEKSFKNDTIGSNEQVQIVNLRHKAIMSTFIKNMYTYDAQIVCPGGLLCLEGVNTLSTEIFSQSAPFGCPLGSYCLLGSESVIGTGLCPQGFFCPAKTETPKPAEPGYFTSNYGAVDQSPCSPGTFQLFSKATKCNFCPAGYMCRNRGTSIPEVCPVGSYRSVIESNICSLCPKGTFAFERGNMDYLACQECPPGRICELEGLKNITETAPCTDGLVCLSGTGARKSILCPEGYYCPEQTTGESMYASQCEGGFFCREGTGLSTKTRDNCPQTYYCPPGSGVYNYVFDYRDYSNWRTDAPTRCPRGSGQDNADTKKFLLQCVINPEYRLLKPGLDMRANFKNPRATTPVQGSRLLRSSSINRRSLATSELAATSAGKDNPLLLDLYEIEFAISQNKKGSSNKAVFQDWLNLQRNYITRINPLNLSICDAWNKSETLDQKTDKNNEPQLIFSLEPHHYAVITMDFRHLLPQEYNWVYGEDWSIAVQIKNKLDLTSKVDPYMLPEQFLHKDTIKSDVIEFQLLALTSCQFRIEVLIHNPLYLNHKYAFQNTTSVEIRKPNRAKYDTDQIIATQIEESFFITLPYNQYPLQPNKQQLPIALISFAKNYIKYDPIVHSEVKNRNIWIPASLYWNQRTTLTMSYLPYFSNCQGYGDYIPLWALMEQHYQCSLISVNDTIQMKELSFGQNPTSDSCDSVVIPCVYDEIPGNGQPLPRWFEVEAGTTLFNIIKEPINFLDYKTRIFDTSELLAVGPGDQGADSEGNIPQNYIFTISYYQLNNTYKRLIQAGIEYDQFLEMSESQANGEEKIPYNITFNLESMSHEALTIAFAFQPYFYIILFIIMGVFSITAMIAMCIYHRIVARPYFGKIAPFRFFSFIKLTIPPCAYGVGLACVPVLIMNLLITIIVNGRVLTYPVQLFTCITTLEDGSQIPSAPQECKSTVFDLVKDDAARISVDYELLRKGRCGLSLFISGVYCINVGQQILIPDTTNKQRVAEAYDGNVWTYYKWKRSNLIYCSIWVIFIALALIQFSFSDYFGAQIYLSIVLLKVFDQFLEVWLEKMLEENLIFAPLMIYYGLICGLVTFGSNDFLDFINAYFIEFGMMIYERTYNNDVIDFVKEYIEEDIPNFFQKFIEFWKSETGDINIFGGDDSESSDSKLNMTDEDSFEEEKVQNDVNFNEQALYKADAFWQDNNSSSDFSAKFKVKTDKPKGIESRDDSDQSSSVIEYGQETRSERGSSRLESSEEGSNVEEESSMDDGLNEVEVEPLLDEYLNYASDDIGLFYAPIFVLLLWAFYPETVVAENYGIMIYDFKYYFLFQVVIVPFQVVVDVIQLNITEWYHHKPLHDYLDYLAFRFTLRKARWKGDEGNENINTFIEKNLQSLDQLCFSSQFYFVQTIYVAGMAQVTLGMQTLLWVPSYNVFSDLATIPISLIIFALCVCTEKLCLKAGDILRIWHIDEVIEKEVHNDDVDEFKFLVKKVQQMQMQNEEPEPEDLEDDIPPHLLWSHKNWGQLDRQKIADLQMKADLNTDRVIAQNFKDIFLEHNKPWLKANVHEILTPRTIFVHRDKLIDQLGLILEPENQSHSQVKALDESVQSGVDTSSVSITSIDSSEAENPFALLQKAQKKKALVKQQRLEEEDQRNKKMSKEQLDRITVPSRLVIKYWLLRTRLLRKLRIYVQQTIDMNIQIECLFCRTQYGLRVEVMESLEDMFFDFLEVTQSTIGDYKYQQWIRYFKKYASFRTTCYNCYEKLEIAYRANRRKIRKMNKIQAKRQKEADQIRDLTLADRRKHYEHIYSRSDRAIEVIGLWLSQTRLRLSLKAEVDQRNDFFDRRNKRQRQMRQQKLSESFIEKQLIREGLDIPKQ